MGLSIGDVIDGKYRIVRLLGEGGMGAVYEGENIRIHRSVAIKVLHAGVADNKEAVQRFEREAQAAGRIGSEHIVEVLDLGNLPDGDRFMVMEYLQGDSLSSRIQSRGRLSPQETYRIVRQILEGLKAAHGAGIIHRDLKPDNAFLLKSRGGQPDFVKLLDFGISKFSTLSGEAGFSMTRTGAVMGTPYYMSPEQAKGGKDLDLRSDLYAVGVIVYEAITGRVPFNADTFNELLFKIVLEAPEPIERIVPDCDPAFVQIVQKAMARDPAQRYQSAAEFQQVLDQWAQGAGAAAMPMVAAAPAAMAQAPAAAASAVVPQGAGPAAQTGTAGAWSNTDARLPEGGQLKKSNTGMTIGIAAGALVVIGAIGFVVTRKGGGEAQAAASAAASASAASAGPSPEEQKAIDEAKRQAAEAQQQADEKIRKAEEEARAAEDRAKAAEATSKTQEEAKLARERANKLRATSQTKPVSTAKAEGSPASTATPSGGRKIRTDL